MLDDESDEQWSWAVGLELSVLQKLLLNDGERDVQPMSFWRLQKLISNKFLYNSFMFNIAINSFRELIRNRILGVIFLFACLLILFSVVLSGLSLGQTGRIITDF